MMDDDGFQAFADATGIALNFRMNSRSLSRLAEIYDAWRSVTPPSEWGCGEIVQCRRIGSVIEMRLSGGTVVAVRLRKRSGPKSVPSGRRVRLPDDH